MKNYLLLAISLGVLASCGGSAEQKELSGDEKRLSDLKDSLTELRTNFKIKEAPLVAEIDRLSDILGANNLTVVKTIEVKSQEFDSYFEVHGVVETNQNIQIMPEAQGVIKSIKVKEGQKVSKGQVLAIIDTELISKQISELKKSLELATTIFEKQQKLRDANVGTEMDYLQAKNQKESLEKTLSTLNSQLNKAVIKAPISGSIDDIFPNVGEMASPAMPFARIINVDEVYIKADVSESSLGKISVGDKVTINVPSLGKKVDAKISYVGNYINPLNRTFAIHVSLPNKDGVFLPNLLTELTIRDAHLDDAITVPTKVILNDGTNNYTYIVEKQDGSNIVKKQIIKTGVDYDGNIVVTEGLKAGQLVIIEGQTVVSAGSKVNLLKD